MLALRILLVLAAFLALPACHPKPGPAPGPSGFVSCAGKAISDHAAQMVGPVNECLRGNGDVTDCMLGLVQPTAGITLETILCVVRHEGSAANAASQVNPDNKPDAKRAARAREFLDKQHVKFAD